MAVSSVAAFWSLSFLLVLTPGADWSYAISAGLRHRTIVPAVGGLLTGYLLLAAVVAAGVAALVARSPHLLTGFTLAGAAYLVWLGSRILFVSPSGRLHTGAERGAPDSWVRDAVKGVGVSALNPKGLLLFLALLPQFTDSNSPWPIPLQIVALGLAHTASCAVVYTAVGTGARHVLRARPSAGRVVTWLSGAVMIVVGLALLIERVAT
jgi:threonine/homoserine/homoserine lactone efflux protein